MNEHVDSKNCNSNEKWNNNKFRCDCKDSKEHHVCKKCYIFNVAKCSFKTGKYVGSINEESVTICDKIIEEIKNVLTKFVLTK